MRKGDKGPSFPRPDNMEDWNFKRPFENDPWGGSDSRSEADGVSRRQIGEMLIQGYEDLDPEDGSSPILCKSKYPLRRLDYTKCPVCNKKRKGPPELRGGKRLWTCGCGHRWYSE